MSATLTLTDTSAAQPVPCRLAVVSQHPIPYHACLWRALAGMPGLDLKVLYCAPAWNTKTADPEYGVPFQWDTPLLDGYDFAFHRNWSRARKSRFLRFINPGLVWEVLSGPYDAVYVHGHNHLTHVLAIVAAKLSGKRLILRTISYNLGHRPFAKRLMRALIYRVLYLLVDRFLYIGRHNHDYFRAFGARPRDLVHAPHVVDNAAFAAERAHLVSARADIRADFGIPEGCKVLLYCAKLIDKKQPEMLIRAYRRARIEGWVLLMVGDGPLRADLEALAAARADRPVIFAGFVNQSRIARAYVAADLLVLPSAYQETWGLVVNEAMNFGLPVLVSDRVGCAPDLVGAGAGEVFAHDDADALVRGLERLCGDDGLRAAYGRNAEAIIARWSVREFLQGTLQALEGAATGLRTAR